MNKKLLTLGIAFLMLFSVFGQTSCSNKHTIYEEDYFQYIIIDENDPFPYNNYGKDAVVIVGFTELGKEQEVIDFPREIDGKPVVAIGYRDEGISTIIVIMFIVKNSEKYIFMTT